jgi:hypothetical protein
MLIHGLIHLMGFVKMLRPDPATNRRNIPAGEGLGWLFCTAVFLTSAILLFSCSHIWWMFAAAGVLVSQILIFVTWKEARFGTLINGLVLIAIIAGYGGWSFSKKITAGHRLMMESPQGTNAADPAKADQLPEPVRKWLQRCGALMHVSEPAVFIRQVGEMRTEPEGKWIPVHSRQWNRTDHPFFMWSARVKMAPGVSLLGRDMYYNGHGHMLIKAAGIIKISDAKGPATDQGSLLRFMGEMVWYPQAALMPYITWQQTAPNAARATMTWKGLTASGIFTFNNEGDVLSFEADRYYDNDGTSTLEKWHVSCDPASIRDFGGIRAPARSEITWKLKSGDFTWYRLQVLDIQYEEGPSKLPLPR